MASFATTEAAPVAAQTISGAPPQLQQQHSPLEQQHESQQQQLHTIGMQQQQQQQQALLQGGPADPATGGRSGSSSSNALNLGLGILRGLGLERKTNRDGQPPKRRGPKPDSKPALTRRQELNRQAQRTHRQRKEVYIKSLEDQVMHLKELFAHQAQERNVIDEENRKLKELLQLHGIQFPNELAQHIAAHHQQQMPTDNTYPGSFSASDGGAGQGNSDYETPSSYQASGSDAGGPAGPSSAMSNPSDGTPHHTQPHLHQHHHHHHQQQQRQQQQQQFQTGQANQLLQDHLIQGSAEENQFGIDFVLALEAFCHDHQQYLVVRSSQSIESAEPVASGHALMLSCPPTSHIQTNPSEQYPHRAPPIPTASLASLLQSARQLPWVGDGEVTPIMALDLIQTDARYPTMAIKEFVAVRKELEEKTRCYGFGAVLEEFEVRDALENVFLSRVVPT